jgi:hypothetical protein
MSPSIFKTVRRLNTETAVREHHTGTMPSILNLVARQETPRLKRTDQVQQGHAWIYHCQDFHGVLLRVDKTQLTKSFYGFANGNENELSLD